MGLDFGTSAWQHVGQCTLYPGDNRRLLPRMVEAPLSLLHPYFCLRCPANIVTCNSFNVGSTRQEHFSSWSHQRRSQSPGRSLRVLRNYSVRCSICDLARCLSRLVLYSPHIPARVSSHSARQANRISELLHTFVGRYNCSLCHAPNTGRDP